MSTEQKKQYQSDEITRFIGDECNYHALKAIHPSLSANGPVVRVATKNGIELGIDDFVSMHGVTTIYDVDQRAFWEQNSVANHIVAELKQNQGHLAIKIPEAIKTAFAKDANLGYCAFLLNDSTIEQYRKHFSAQEQDEYDVPAKHSSADI